MRGMLAAFADVAWLAGEPLTKAVQREVKARHALCGGPRHQPIRGNGQAAQSRHLQGGHSRLDHDQMGPIGSRTNAWNADNSLFNKLVVRILGYKTIKLRNTP